MKDELATKAREERFPGESIILPHAEQVQNLVQTFDNFITERSRVMETVIAVGSAMTDTFNVLLTEFQTVVNELKNVCQQKDNLSKEVSALVQENNRLTQELELITMRQKLDLPFKEPVKEDIGAGLDQIRDKHLEP